MSGVRVPAGVCLSVIPRAGRRGHSHSAACRHEEAFPGGILLSLQRAFQRLWPPPEGRGCLEFHLCPLTLEALPNFPGLGSSP